MCRLIPEENDWRNPPKSSFQCKDSTTNRLTFSCDRNIAWDLFTSLSTSSGESVWLNSAQTLPTAVLQHSGQIISPLTKCLFIFSYDPAPCRRWRADADLILCGNQETVAERRANQINDGSPCLFNERMWCGCGAAGLLPADEINGLILDMIRPLWKVWWPGRLEWREFMTFGNIIWPECCHQWSIEFSQYGCRNSHGNSNNIRRLTWNSQLTSNEM